MRDRTKDILSGFLALALSVLLVPGAADAQEQQTPEQGECTVEVTPQPVQSGEAAVSVTARLSQSVGAVEGFKAPDESGLELADANDIQKRSMAREEGEGEPQPIQMARGDSQVTLWLNTENAESGSYEVTLEGANGVCEGNVSVGEQGGERPGTGR